MKKNWATNITFHDSETWHPKTTGELSAIVARSEKIRVRGSGHCFNTIADSYGPVVMLDALQNEMRIDPESKTATVGAGINYAVVSEFLESHGWALHNLASLPHISIGGAFATGTHGSGIQNGALHTAIKSVDLVQADGSIKTLVRDVDPEFFAVIVGWGRTGIAVSFEVAIEPTYVLMQTVYGDLPHSVFQENILDVLSGGYSVSYFTAWKDTKIGDVWLKSKTLPTSDYFGVGARNVKAHPIFGEDADSCTEQFGVPGPWYLRLPHFRIDANPSAGNELQSEFFVASENAAQGFAAVEAISHNFAHKVLVTEVRAIAADEHWMSPAYGRETVAFHFTWKSDYEIPYFVSLIEEALMPYSFRPHIGKVFNVESPHFYKVWSQFGAFKDYVMQVDPKGKFGNKFTDQLLRTHTGQ